MPNLKLFWTFLNFLTLITEKQVLGVRWIWETTQQNKIMFFWTFWSIGFNFVFFFYLEFWEHLIDQFDPASCELRYDLFAFNDNKMGDCFDFILIAEFNAINKVYVNNSNFLFVNVFLFYLFDCSPRRYRPVSNEA